MSDSKQMPHCEAHLFMKTVSPEPPVWLAGSTTGGSPLLIAVTYLLIALVGRPWTFCHFLRFVGLINFISFPRLLTFPLSLGNIFFYIFWTLFYVLVFYLEVWLCAMYVSGNCRGQKRALAPLDLIVSHHMDTGFEPGSFARTNHLTHWATSPAQNSCTTVTKPR